MDLDLPSLARRTKRTGHLHVNQFAHANRHSDTHAHCHRHAHSQPDTDRHQNANPHAYGNQDRHPHRHADVHPDSTALGNANPDRLAGPFAQSNADGLALHDRHGHAHAHSQRNAEPHPYGNRHTPTDADNALAGRAPPHLDPWPTIANAEPYPDGLALARADPHADRCAHSHTYAHGNRHCNADADRHSDAHAGGLQLHRQQQYAAVPLSFLPLRFAHQPRAPCLLRHPRGRHRRRVCALSGVPAMRLLARRVQSTLRASGLQRSGLLCNAPTPDPAPAGGGE